MADEDVFGNRQSQPRSLDVFVLVRLHAVKALGQAVEVFVGNFFAEVVHRNCHRPAAGHFMAFGRRHRFRNPGGNGNVGVFAAVFDRVVAKVLQKLADLTVIGGDLRQVTFDFQFKFHVFRPCF